MKKQENNAINTIYVITNTINGKMYVGQTWQKLRRRFRGHINEAIRNPKFKLERAIYKYGEENFAVEVIVETTTQSMADYLEDFYILAGDTIKNGYNIRRGGKGARWSESSKRKLSKTCKGRVISKQQREKLRKANLGKKIPDEVKNRISQTMLKEGTKRGDNSSMAKLTEKEVKTIKGLLVKDKIHKEDIAKQYGVSVATIQNIAAGRRWSYIKVRGKIRSGKARGEKSGSAQLTEREVKIMRKRFAKGETVSAIAKDIGIPRPTVDCVVRRITWKHIK